ncbi:MAG TPA: hypothetical protein DFK12_14100 [Gallionellaceae bacterium]|nr:hypothetical protein [Gallionellaceae bacterium]
MDKSRGSNELGYLASPVSGGGIVVGRIQQLFLLAMGQGKKQPAEWAQFVWQILSAQGQKLVKDGKTLETEEGTSPNSPPKPPPSPRNSCRC